MISANELEFVTWHPLSTADIAPLERLRKARALLDKQTLTPAERRARYDANIADARAAAGVAFGAAQLNGVQGFWCTKNGGIRDAVMLYLHGGAYVVGSAAAYRNYVGQIVHRTGIPAFIADYRLAPEHPFPAALDDASAAYRGLEALGYTSIAIVGDSAGGGLSLATLAYATSREKGRTVSPWACAVTSAWTDLTLSGRSMRERADADFLLKPKAVSGAAASYLNGHAADDPRVSPLFGDLSGLPPLLLHVGTDELLLHDTLRYVDRARAAGVDATGHVWEGMIHNFPTNYGMFTSSEEAVNITAAFLLETYQTRAVDLRSRLQSD